MKIVLFLAFAFLGVTDSKGIVLKNDTKVNPESDSKIEANVNTVSNLRIDSRVLATNSLKASSNVNAVSDSSSSSTQCGGVLKGPSGTISYKPYSQVNENERCVWTVRTINGTAYRFTVNRLSSPLSVVISGVQTTGSLTHYVPNLQSTYYVYGSVAVVTFYSTNVTGNGFILTYNTYTSNGNEGSTSREVVAPSNIGAIRHPANDDLLYANLDLSVFVFIPSCVNNFEQTTQVIYIRDALEGTSCNDKLHLYRFNVTLGNTNKWSSIGQICGSSVSEVISSRDLILIVFQSDSSVGNTGFHLYSMNT